MARSIDEILDTYAIKYCAESQGGKSVIILARPYSPYKKLPKGYGSIDSFYIASNELYHTAKDIRRELEREGYLTYDGEVNLKATGERCGLGTILYNQLLCNREYGSKMTLQGIIIGGEFSRTLDERVDKICESCGLCDLACPTAALCKGVFTRDKCLRHIQDFPDRKSEFIGERILGCDECQRACPYNDKPCVEMPSELREMLRYDNLKALLASGKAGMRAIGEYIGSNYARANYIGKLIHNVVDEANDD